MGHPLKSIPAIVLLVLSVVSPGVAAQDLPGVQLETVNPGTIRQEVTLNGTVTALRVSGISASVAGLLEQVEVETGDRVARGDTLVALDDELARWELEAASAEVEEARSRLEEAERRLTEARSVGAGRNIAATEVSARDSEVETSRAALERHRVTSPFDGVISQRSRDIGEWVTPGDQLLTLVDTGNLRLDFRVPQDFYARVDDNTRLLVHAGGDRVPANIDLLVPVNDPQARTFLLRGVKPEPVRLLPGMAVQATLQVTTGEQGLTISRDAINRYPEGRVTVWLAEPDDGDTWTVREKRVYLGAGFDGKVEVTRGLEQGQKVVVRGNESLTEGMRVKISERESR